MSETNKEDELIYEVAHRNSMLNRPEIEKSKKCGCFHCLRIFNRSEINEWTDNQENLEGDTAICPYCEIDSVLGDASGYDINREFLINMHNFWFDGK